MYVIACEQGDASGRLEVNFEYNFLITSTAGISSGSKNLPLLRPFNSVNILKSSLLGKDLQLKQKISEKSLHTRVAFYISGLENKKQILIIENHFIVFQNIPH